MPDCLAGDAVLIAPVSKQIPWYQGILQGILRFWGLGTRFSAKKPLRCSHFLSNSLRKLTGKIFWGTGNLFQVTGNFYVILESVNFSHACFFAARTRFVLTNKFSGGERDVVSSRAVRRGFLAGAPRGLGSKRAQSA